MAAGEKSFSTADAKKTKRNFDPVKAGDYELKIIGASTEIRIAEPRMNEKTKKMSRPVPRVSCRFEALNSADEEGGRNKLIFHDLYTSMEPDKSGVLIPTGADQLKGLADALGADADIPFVMFQPKGGGEKVKILDPKALANWIKAHNGEVVSAHIKVQAGTKDFPEPKNKLTEFFEAGGGKAGGEDAGSGDDEGIPDADEAAGDDELPEADLEEEKNPKKQAKPAPKKGKR